MHEPFECTCAEDFEEFAEAYVLGRLNQAEATVLENHVSRCPACAAMLEKTRLYVESLKVAGKFVVGGRSKSRPASEGTK
jgi:hypothetical protein